MFIAPDRAYLTRIVIPESQLIPIAVMRCFSRTGRMKGIDDLMWEPGYSFHPLRILTTSKEFNYSKRRTPSPASPPRPSNLAAVWNPYGEEIIINGVLQGRQQTDKNCASMLSKSRLTAIVRCSLGNKWSDTVSTYTKFKHYHPQLIARANVKNQVIKQVLSGWVRNEPDDFELSTSVLLPCRTDSGSPDTLDTGTGR